MTPTKAAGASQADAPNRKTRGAVFFELARVRRVGAFRRACLAPLSLIACTAFAQTTITYTNGQNDSTNYDSNALGDLTLTIASGAATQSGILSGYGNIYKTGGGALTLTGVNTYSGPMTISAGTLALSGSGTLGNGSSLVFLTNNATLDLGGTTQNISSLGDSATFVVGNITAGTITASGEIVLQSGTFAATFTLAGFANLYIGGDTSATVTLNGTNNRDQPGDHVFIGDASTGAAGTVKLGNANALADAQGDVNLYTGTLDLNGIADVRANSIYLRSGSDSVLVNNNTSSAASYAGIVFLVGGGTQIGGAGNLTLSGSIWDAGGLTKVGAGTLTLSGENYFTGDTVVSGGTLRLGHALALQISTLQAPGPGGLSFGSLTSATIGGLTGSNGLVLANDNNDPVTLMVGNDSGISSTYAGVLSGSGSLTKTGGSEFTLSGANTYAGGTNLAGGLLVLGSGAALPNSGAISFSGGGLKYSAANTTDYSSRFTSGNNQPYRIDTGGQNVTFASAVTGSNGLFKSGDGTLTLTGANNYSGFGVGVFGGTLALSGSGTLDVGDSGIQIDGGTLDLGGKSITATSARFFSGSLSNGTVIAAQGYISDNGNATVSANLAGNVPLDKYSVGPVLTLTGTNTYTGPTTIHAGTLQIGNGGTSGSIVSDVVNDGDLTFNRSNALTYSGAISGSGTLTKLGAGALTLSGANTYSGSTTISGGTLLVNGSLGNTAMTVASGATLGGSGTIGGLATLASGAHLAPGSSPGTLTFTNGLTLLSGTVLNFELGSTSDLIAITGGPLTGPSGTGGLTLNIFDAGGFSAGTYTLFDFTSGGVTTNSFDVSDFVFGSTISGFDYSLAFNGNTLELTSSVSAVPEPATYAAVLGTAVIGLAAWRKRRPHA
ncbi:MAG TPA: autotransporter-associated beta strand repeat-containing protein [Opitutaceae bacterium]|nr:autotransporter-associated beta strand repeat-containing protein [Opitutaceae bacterium]